MRRNGNMVLALDIGGTFIKWAIADGYSFIDQGKTETPKDSLGSLIAEIKKLLKRAGESDIEGVAVSFPAMCDPTTGIVLPIASLEYLKGQIVEKELSEALDFPLIIENDGRCAAVAEALLGNLRDVEDGYVLVVGTGIGGAYVRNGQVLSGAHGYAGQMSLLLQDEPRKVGIDSLLSKYLGMADFTAHASAVLSVPNLTGERFMEMVSDGNETAKEIFEEYARLFPGKVKERLKEMDADASVVSWAMRFAGSLDGVICNLSGMSTLEQVKDNIRIVKSLDPLTQEEKEQLLGDVVRIYKDAGPCGSDLSRYEGLSLHSAAVSAIMEGYNVCQLQPDPGYSDDNNYLKNVVAENAHLDIFGELPKERLILEDGTDVTDEVFEAEKWLIQNSF